MFRTYIKIACRNLVKTKGYSAINIAGLAVGIAIAMLIGLWLYDEVQFNKFHKNYNKIAQVMSGANFNGQRSVSWSLQRPLEMVLRNKYGGHFKHIVMSRYNEDHILSIGDTRITQTGRFMQPGAPDMLSLRILKGSKLGLKDRFSIMLSTSAATALFGNAEPIGKILRMDNQLNVKVTAVYADIPYNSEFKNIEFLAPWDLVIANTPWMQEAATNWGNTSFLIYVQLADNQDFKSVNAAIKNAIQDNVDPDDKKYNYQTFLNPMSRWHLYSEWRDGINTGGRIQYVWMFTIIGIFVLLLACINFMNLSTARSEGRAKEVGIRKAVGSVRVQLVKQFLIESLVVVVISFSFGMLLVSVSLPWFNELSDKQMKISWLNPMFWAISIAFVLITSVISGSYPAFYLSSFNPVKVLKGTFQAGRWAAVPRKVLVVLQFTVSVALIIGTIIVYRQIQYAKNRPIGYDRQGLVSIHIKSDDLRENYPLLASELKQQRIATAVASASSPLTAVWSNSGGFEWRGKDPNKVEAFGMIYITHDFGKVVGWDFKVGRDFSEAFALDSIGEEPSKELVYNVVINDAARKYMNFDKAEGEIMTISGYKVRVIGVINDMLMESPFDQVRQTVYLVSKSQAREMIHIRLNPDMSMSEAIAKMGKVFKRLAPAVPFEYTFADSEYVAKFSAEERIGKLASLFTSLAVFISCLGLFGLASFVAEKRTKEIGIRKVLGASVYNLWKMLSKDFVFLILLSCVIATPIAYYFLDQWLQKYPYRTTISWWVFIAAIAGSLFITLMTVSFQAIKAALSNPVKTLRSE
jgi:putative ABC transport system permease protein